MLRQPQNKGMTLIELLVASSVTVILLLALLPLMSSSVRAWHRTSHDVATTMDVTLAMRRIASELRYAKSVLITEGGQKIQYILPDNTSAYFKLSGNELTWSWGQEPLLRGVVTSDPEYGGTYPIFQLAFGGGTSRAVLVRLCVRVNTPAGIRTHRAQQLVVLRNQ
ncbi:MAG: prepilin-type N-terminal cleavage/methylation domain-containing protein [Chthonomonadetes bacterium]|nr:prepilin-type N-terminal cleavage/methylation domain-containing protein [Chthonomonadetes bacterium]